MANRIALYDNFQFILYELGNLTVTIKPESFGTHFKELSDLKICFEGMTPNQCLTNLTFNQLFVPKPYITDLLPKLLLLVLGINCIIAIIYTFCCYVRTRNKK